MKTTYIEPSHYAFFIYSSVVSSEIQMFPTVPCSQKSLEWYTDWWPSDIHEGTNAALEETCIATKWTD